MTIFANPSTALGSVEALPPDPVQFGLRGQVRAHLSVPLFRSAYNLIASTIITSVLGVAYWALAAHYYSPAQVGYASAAVSMMLLLSGLAQANQHNMLPRLIPLAGARAGRLVAKAYLTCGAIAAVASTVFVVGFGHSTFLGQYHSTAVDAWFVVSVVAWCIFTLQDAVLTGFRATGWVPIENAAFAVAKIILLVVLAASLPRLGLFTAWTLPTVASIIPITWLVYARLVPRHRDVRITSAYLTPGRSMSRFVVADSIGGLLQMSGTMLLPVLVAARLGYAEAGWFYAAWIVGSAFDTMLLNVTSSLTVEGAHNESAIRDLLRTLAKAAIPLLAICAGIVVAAGPLLGVLGSSYADHATRLLQLIAAGMVMRAIALVAVSVARLRRQILRLVVVQTSLAALLLTGAIVLGGRYGLTGIGIAYVIAQTVVGLAVLPSLISVATQPELAPVVDLDRAAPRRPTRTRANRQTTGLAIALLTGTALAMVALVRASSAQIGDAGLANALPPLYWIGAGLLVLGSVITAVRRPLARLLAPAVVAMVVVFQGAATIVENEPRFYTAWLHAGFVQYISQHGATDPHLDARFSWPGMFAATASLLHSAGLTNALSLLAWTPVVLTVACLPAVWSIAAWASADRRVRWLTVVLFILGDWVGQDYFSPQAVAYVMALGVIAAVLRLFPAAPAGRSIRAWLRPPVRLETTASARQRRLAIVILVLTVGGIVVTHQLTPVFLCIDLVLLVIFRRTSLATMPAIVLMLFLGWLSLGAEAFWSGHISFLFGGAGKLGSNVGANVGNRATGDAAHNFAVHLRIGLTLVAFAASGLGFLRWRDSKRWVVAALALVPFTLVFVQSYGGEAVLRSYLFALPFLAILSANAIVAHPAAGRVRSTFAIATAAGLALAMAAGFVVVRWSNERFEMVSTTEVSALKWFYGNAPHGSRVIDADQALPWRYRELTTYNYNPIDNTSITDAATIYNDLVASDNGYGYFISSDPERWYGVEMLRLKPDWLDVLDGKLAARPGMSLVFSDGGTRIYEYRPAAKGHS